LRSARRCRSRSSSRAVDQHPQHVAMPKDAEASAGGLQRSGVTTFEPSGTTTVDPGRATTVVGRSVVSQLDRAVIITRASTSLCMVRSSRLAKAAICAKVSVWLTPAIALREPAPDLRQKSCGRRAAGFDTGWLRCSGRDRVRAVALFLAPTYIAARRTDPEPEPPSGPNALV
jgi:hypothetical protein